MKNFIIVAIDGGAASGKSSTSRKLSEKYHFFHVDTGSHYRTLTYHLLKAGIFPEDGRKIEEFLKHLPIDTVIENRRSLIRINGKLLEDADIRSEEVTKFVSIFASNPEIRNFLKKYQQNQANIGKDHGFKGLIMEGRDIGTVIFPNADLCVFLEANLEARALRREKEGLTDSIAERDKLDITRKTAPLSCSPRAIKVDTSTMSLEEVTSHIGRLIENIENFSDGKE